MSDPLTPGRTTPLLRDEVARLCRDHPDLVPLVFREGEWLVREGEVSREIFLVLRGAAVVEQGEGGARRVLACLEANPETPVLLGEMAYLGDLPRTASVRASGATEVLRLEPRHIDAVLEGYPGLTALICRQFTQRLQEANHAIQALQARFLLDPVRRMAQDGEVLFRAGEGATDLVQLMAGEVRLGDRIVTPETLPGGFLNLAAYLTGTPHPETGVVVGMAFLALLSEVRREAVVRTFPGLVLALLRS